MVFAIKPYSIKVMNVRAINIALSKSNCTSAEYGAFSCTNWGRNAKKNKVSFGLKRLSNKALMINRIPDSEAAWESASHCSVSRHVSHAR